MTIETTKTSDGLTLHGMLLEAEAPRTDLMIDSLIMVHGSNGNFYSSAGVHRAAKLAELGIPVALFNTRGHDTIAGAGQSGGKKVGNAYELLSETHFDIQAMVDWMADRGFQRIGLLGSSLGTVRVVLAQAKNQDPRVACVIAVGPLRFSHEYFLQSAEADVHRKHYEEARALVDAGKGDQIIGVDSPNKGGIFSAAVHLDRHCSEHYDITAAHSDRITCPFMVLTGTEEKLPRMLDCGRDIAALVGDKNPGFRWVHIEGGDHGMHTMDEVFFREVMGFLGAKAPVAAG
jgi:pimeloyl-ACP methyl ester carboxylesterase